MAKIKPSMGDTWRRVAEGSSACPPGSEVEVVFVSTTGRYRTVEFTFGGVRYQSAMSRFLARFERVARELPDAS